MCARYSLQKLSAGLIQPAMKSALPQFMLLFIFPVFGTLVKHNPRKISDANQPTVPSPLGRADTHLEEESQLELATSTFSKLHLPCVILCVTMVTVLILTALLENLLNAWNYVVD